MPVLLALAVFGAAFAIEFCGVLHQRAVNALDPMRAANVALLWFAMTTIGLYAYVAHGAIYLAPEGAGWWIGSYVAVAFARHRAKNV